jgi:hypothetical protein
VSNWWYAGLRLLHARQNTAGVLPNCHMEIVPNPNPLAFPSTAKGGRTIIMSFQMASSAYIHRRPHRYRCTCNIRPKPYEPFLICRLSTVHIRYHVPFDFHPGSATAVFTCLIPNVHLHPLTDKADNTVDSLQCCRRHIIGKHLMNIRLAPLGDHGLSTTRLLP